MSLTTQHITYNEWLPLVLGLDFMEELDIGPINYGYSNRYDPKVRPSREFSFQVSYLNVSKVNPTVINSFASAAFRFGHTLIQGMLE